MYCPTYCSSTISLRTSFSLNEYSYCSNERCPSSYCSCCCSNLSRYVVPVNPSFLYGLRQSTLIQCPPSRRLTFGSRPPVSDVGLCCNGEWCCGKRDRVDTNTYCCEKVSVNRQQLLPMYVPLTPGVGRSRCKSITLGEGGSKMSVNVNVNRIRDRVARRNYRCNALGDAEAILSLLTEEPVEQLLDARGRGSRSSKDENDFCVDSRFKKENLQSGYLGGQSGRHRVEFAEMKSKEEVNKWREEREALLNDEERRSRRKESCTWDSGSLLDKVNLVSSEVQSKKVSYGRRREEDMEVFSREEERWSRRNESGSSYYSASNMSDSESDTEVEIQDERLAEESSARHGKDSKQMGSVLIKDEKKKELGRYRVGSYVACNSKENTEGIVISDKEKRESEWNKDVKNHQELQSHKHDEVRVGSVTGWDWRNKSEKRLTEESTEATKSRKDSVVRHFMKSSTPEQFNHQEEGSTSGASFHGQLISHIEKDNQVSELSRLSARRHEQATQTARHEIELTSNVQGRSNQGEESMSIVGQSVQETGCKYCETCRKIMQENKSQTGFQQMSELSEIHNDAKWTSTVQSESESRLRKHEQSSTSLQTSVQEENYLLDQIRTQINSVTVDSQDNYVEGSSSSQQQSDAYKKSLEEMSSLLVIRQEVKGSEKTSGHKFSKENESSRVPQTGISASQVHTTKAEINSQSASDQHHSETVYAHDNYAKETSSSRQEILSSVISQGVKELQEKVGQEVIKEIESSRVGQTGTSSSLVHSTNAEINQWSASNQHIYNEQIYSTKVKSEEVLIEKYKHIDETNVQSRVRTEIQRPIMEDTYAGNLSGEATVSQPSIALISQIGLQHLSEGEASVYINPQATTSSSSTKFSSGSESYEDPSHGDSLGSAERMEESSVQIVGGFIEDMRHEASTQDSQRQTGTGSESQPRITSSGELSGGRNEPYEEASHEYALVLAERMDESAVQIVGEFVDKMQHEASTSQSTHQESRRSSGNSETKGPSDEMWDAKDHFAQESSERDSSQNTVSENVKVRTGKSLWNILAGVLRLQSGSTAKTQKSSSKSSGHDSSNESVSGEAYSSEDEANGKIVKGKDKTSVPQDPSLRNQRDDRMSHLEVGASSSSNVLQTGSLSAGVSYGGNPIFNVTQETSQSSPVDITVSTSEVTNVEPKQTKLQRANQVLQERYYEWEDAYRREREEKEADEKFMMEALVEAKKAADLWEVPVGAVLVQNGNVIARGYNLVEELRDSTAHAEMICIREASNVLQTWRLSETTLYVTLEPCPMCAGAILQARVGTLVWGAPNKLLGADGSWIRLFRDGLEGEERAEVADKPVAPIHPFHTSMKIRRGVLESECADIMQQFFQLRRGKKKPAQQEPTETPKLSHKLFKFPLIHRKRSS